MHEHYNCTASQQIWRSASRLQWRCANHKPCVRWSEIFSHLSKCTCGGAQQRIIHLSHSTRRKDVKIYQHFLSKHYSGPLFQFTMKEEFSPHFSVCDQYIACIGSTKHCIQQYTRATGKTTELWLPRMKHIHNVKFLKDSSLLLTGRDAQTQNISRYDISIEGKPILVWTCNLPQAFGICITETAILVGGLTDKTIHIISEQGEPTIKFSR